LSRATAWPCFAARRYHCAAFPKAAHEDDVDALIHGLRFIFLGDEQKQEVAMEYEQSEVISPELEQADAGWGAD